MALPNRQQGLIWGVVMALFFLVLWGLGDVLLPFVLGGAVAYLLDPLANRLERRGLSRAAATAIISVSFAVVTVLVLLLVVPPLVRQLVDLFRLAPDLVASIRGFIETNFPSIGAKLEGPNGTLPEVEDVPGLGETIRERGGELLGGLLSSAQTLVTIFIDLFIAAIVAIYLLLDWRRLLRSIDELLPRDHRPTIRRLAGDMDATLAGFVRGQGLVCLILGTFYAIALMIAGLNFGLLIGAVAGLLSFIPMVGSVVGGTLSIGLALFQFWGDWVRVAVIAGIFLLGQLVEGNILTPKMVGDAVGLHPVWLLLALAVFGALFGMLGLLVAVPVSAMIGVLVKFGVEEYRSGELYLGEGSEQDSPGGR